MNERYELSWSICFKLRWVHTILTKLRVSQCFFLLSGQFTEKGEKRNFWEIIMHYKKGEEYFGDVKCEITQLCRVIVLRWKWEAKTRGYEALLQGKKQTSKQALRGLELQDKNLGYIYIYVERKSVSSKCLNHSGGILFSSPWWFTKNPKSLWPTPVPRPEFLFLFHKNLWCPIFDLL